MKFSGPGCKPLENRNIQQTLGMFVDSVSIFFTVFVYEPTFIYMNVDAFL